MQRVAGCNEKVVHSRKLTGMLENSEARFGQAQGSAHCAGSGLTESESVLPR